MANNALAGIDGKIERAEGHIVDLDTAIGDFINSDPYRVEVNDDPKDPDRVCWMLREQRPDTMPTVEFAVLIGDAVHNLRAALDHLACGLVSEASHVPVTRETMFPIFRDPGPRTANDMKALVTSKVSGARQDLIDKLCTLEPYEGGHHEMLWALNYLDVVDKHRVLITAAGATRQLAINMGAMMRTMFAGETGEGATLAQQTPDSWITLNAAEVTFPLEDGTVLTSAPRENSEPYDQFQFPLYVALGEPEILKGEPVIPTLTQLLGAVREVVDLFRPAF